MLSNNKKKQIKKVDDKNKEGIDPSLFEVADPSALITEMVKNLEKDGETDASKIKVLTE
jgi:hypothetical protein